MSQGFKRPIQPANTMTSSTLLNRGFRASLQMVMTIAELMSGRDTLDNTLPAGFLGDAFRLTATGSSNQATLKRGLAWVRDSGDDDAAWSGEVRPIYAEADTLITFGTNGAGSARLDSVFVRPLMSDSDATDLNVKDAVAGPVRVERHDLTRAYGFEVLTVQGTPGGGAPATPAGDGWLRVADVTRDPATVNVAQAKIIDRRYQDVAEGVNESGVLKAAKRLYIGLTKLTGDFAFQLFTAQEAEGNWEAGDLVIADKNFDDVTPSGRVRLGEVVAHTGARLAALRKLGAGALTLLDNAGTQLEALRAKNTIIATFKYDTVVNLPQGFNCLNVSFPGSNVIRLDFEADKHWGGGFGRACLMGTAYKISNGAPLIPVMIGSEDDYATLYLFDLSGTKTVTDFAINLALTTNPTI